MPKSDPSDLSKTPLRCTKKDRVQGDRREATPYIYRKAFSCLQAESTF